MIGNVNLYARIFVFGLPVFASGLQCPVFASSLQYPIFLSGLQCPIFASVLQWMCTCEYIFLKAYIMIYVEFSTRRCFFHSERCIKMITLITLKSWYKKVLKWKIHYPRADVGREISIISVLMNLVFLLTFKKIIAWYHAYMHNTAPYILIRLYWW